MTSFLSEINSAYSLNLTIQDACLLIRQNLPTLSLDSEVQKMIIATIQLFEFSPDQIDEIMYSKIIPHLPQSTVESLCLSVYWPWEWKWFGLNIKRHKKRNSASCIPGGVPLLKSKLPETEKELPGSCYMGGCEMLAGSLIFILPIPGAQWLGGLMVGDGVRRVIDGVIQLGDERRADLIYESPSKAGINF